MTSVHQLRPWSPVMAPHPSRRLDQAGFTLVEALVFMAIGSVMMAVFVGVLPRATTTVQADADLRIVHSQLKLARELAINQRRAVQLQFTPPNQLAIVRRESDGALSVLSTAYLEHNSQFFLFPNQPDTPDGFGNKESVYFGGATAVMFTADGMLTDAAGSPINGSVFLGQPGKPLSASAVTIFGPTAMIRLYRWNGTAWRR